MGRWSATCQGHGSVLRITLMDAIGVLLGVVVCAGLSLALASAEWWQAKRIIVGMVAVEALILVVALATA